MLKAGVFDNFKGATTLLLWGDREGMASLLTGFSALRDGDRSEFTVDAPRGGLVVCSTSKAGENSALSAQADRLRLDCSGTTVELAVGMIEPLLDQAGHQILDVNGLADQVIIARDEHPVDLR